MVLDRNQPEAALVGDPCVLADAVDRVGGGDDRQAGDHGHRMRHAGRARVLGASGARSRRPDSRGGGGLAKGCREWVCRLDPRITLTGPLGPDRDRFGQLTLRLARAGQVVGVRWRAWSADAGAVALNR